MNSSSKSGRPWSAYYVTEGIMQVFVVKWDIFFLTQVKYFLNPLLGV